MLVVPLAVLETATYRLEADRSIHLSYRGKVQYPVIETGAIAWKATMLPLHQYCFGMIDLKNFFKFKSDPDNVN